MPEPQRIVTAGMIVIGNEILSGRTRDANLAYIAVRLGELGVRLREARFIPDDEAVIVETVNQLRQRFDYVFTSGGIGPTHDDITADCIAKAFGVGIDVDPRARALLEAHYPPGHLNEARLRMARIPDGGALIDNPVSKAPGFRMGNVYVMAGVPAILQAMFESIRHELVGGDRLLSRSVAAYVLEGSIAAPLADLQAAHPDVEIGSYPFYRARPGCSIVMRCTDPVELEAVAEAVKAIMRDLGAEPVDGDTP